MKTDSDGSLLEGRAETVDVLQLVDKRCAPTDGGEQVGAMTSTALAAFDSTTALAFGTFSYAKNMSCKRSRYHVTRLTHGLGFQYQPLDFASAAQGLMLLSIAALLVETRWSSDFVFPTISE